MEVQVRFRLAESFARIKKTQKRLFLRIFFVFCCLFAWQTLRYCECLIGQMPVFIVNVQTASEEGLEVDVDGSFTVAFVNYNRLRESLPVATTPATRFGQCARSVFSITGASCLAKYASPSTVR